MALSETALPPRIEPFDPVAVDDPYPTYARFRAAGRICRGGPAQWVVTGYDDVAALLRDPRLSNEFPAEYHAFAGGTGPASEFLRRILLHRDRPEHTRLRRLMGSAFAPQLVGRLGVRIEALVDGLLRPATRSSELDLVSDLAFPLPVLVICELLGIPADARDEVRPHAFDLGRAFAPALPEADRLAADAAVEWLRSFVAARLAGIRPDPDGDALARMLAAEAEGERLTHDEIVDNAVFLFFAGFETTMNLIATGCAALLTHPDQGELLHRNPELAAGAVEEFLRYDAPIQSRLRRVVEPMTVAGRTLRPGRVVLLLIGSANHDPTRFPAPDTLQITRDPNPHLSFGGGIHYCLGATLARLEGRAVFTHIARHLPDLRPTGMPVRRREGGFRAFASVPATAAPRMTATGRVPTRRGPS